MGQGCLHLIYVAAGHAPWGNTAEEGVSYGTRGSKEMKSTESIDSAPTLLFINMYLSLEPQHI